jgi:signal transduction histidine kinase
LRELTRQQHRAREEERTAVAREIHDEFGQVLTGLRIDLSLLARRLLPEQEDLAVKIESMQKLIRDTTKNVQRLATELRPGMLDELGLVAAVEWQLQQVSERTGLTYEFDVDNDEMEIERDTATALFRILQEALTNVVRHSDATQVSVKLEEQSDQLLLVIKDNGRGIDKSQISDSFALGLLGMRERAGALGGDLSIEGAMGMGTTIVVHIPRAAFLEEEL